jgi:putative ABC transport system permease protein
MTFADAVHLALRNLRQSKLRTALTVLGVAIGIASLSGMVSLGVGLQDQFVGRFMRSGVFDSITVLPGEVRLGGPFNIGRAGRGGRGGAGGGGRQNTPASPDAPRKTLDEAALTELGGLENVATAYPIIRVPLEVKFGEHTEFAAAAGVPMSSKGEGAFQKIPHGQFFANETDPACMLSLDKARELHEADPGAMVGKTLTLTYASATPAAGNPSVPLAMQVQRVSIECTVTGIVERETGPAPGANTVAALMIPLARAREMNATIQLTQRLMRGRGGEGLYSSIAVKVTRPQHTQDVEDRIKKLGYSAFSLNDALEGAKRAFLILDIILGLIGSIALAVASLGIMNTMVMSILERTREIGIMKAIGGSDSDVRRIFLIEAAVIGVLGGIAGLVLGWGVGRIINFGANQYIVSQGGTPGNLFAIPLWLVGSAIAFSIFVSLAAGAYPARRAARLDPIQALRHD